MNQSQSKTDLDSLCQTLLMTIVSGRLSYLPRLTTIIGHLEPSPDTGNLDETQRTKTLPDTVCVPNLFDPQTVVAVFQKLNKNQLSFPKLMSALDTQNFSLIVDPKYVTIPFVADFS